MTFLNVAPIAGGSRAPIFLHRTHPEDPLLSMKVSLREQITEIGRVDPDRAAELSFRVIRCHWSTREIDALRNRGLQISGVQTSMQLLGGVSQEVLGFLKRDSAKGIKLIAEGSRAAQEVYAGEDSVEACITLPSGAIDKGHHRGLREIVEIGYSCWLCCPLYEVEAMGKGLFVSNQVRYDGEFLHNLFHDLTGTAVLLFESHSRYTGCFFQGKRHGYGRLENYDSALGRFYVQFDGDWKNDHVYQGLIYDAEGRAEEYQSQDYAIDHREHPLVPSNFNHSQLQQLSDPPAPQNASPMQWSPHAPSSPSQFGAQADSPAPSRPQQVSSPFRFESRSESSLSGPGLELKSVS